MELRVWGLEFKCKEVASTKFPVRRPQIALFSTEPPCPTPLAITRKTSTLKSPGLASIHPDKNAPSPRLIPSIRRSLKMVSDGLDICLLNRESHVFRNVETSPRAFPAPPFPKEELKVDFVNTTTLKSLGSASISRQKCPSPLPTSSKQYQRPGRATAASIARKTREPGVSPFPKGRNGKRDSWSPRN